MYRKSAYLITYTDSVNELYDAVRIPVKRKVYANKESVSQTEHYQASAQGLKADIKLKIREKSYNGEIQIEYDDIIYNIIRTHEANGEVELTCQGVVNNGST